MFDVVSAITFLNISHGAWHVVFGGFSNVDFFIHLVQSGYMAVTSRSKLEAIFWVYIFCTVVGSGFVFHTFGVASHHSYYHHPVNFIKWPAFIYCSFIQGLNLVKDERRYSWKMIAMCVLITFPSYLVSLQTLEDENLVTTETFEMLGETALIFLVYLLPNHLLSLGSAIGFFKMVQFFSILFKDGSFGFAKILATSDAAKISINAALLMCLLSVVPFYASNAKCKIHRRLSSMLHHFV